MHKYINNDTFEFVDNVFEVDELIADTIKVLNKKGYYTRYSCSGHVSDFRIYELHNDYNIKDNIGYLMDDGSRLIPYTFTTVYVFFDNNYNFQTLPDGFVKNNNVIEFIIDYYIDGVRKKNDDIANEIMFANRILLEWAMSLSNR